MGDLHEAVFRWPHTEPTTVILTGTFDQWSSSIYLTKGESGFEGIAKLPWEERIVYKFIVDGQWVIHEGQPTETDHSGNINNVYTSPSKPPLAKAIEPTPKATEPVNGSANSVSSSDKVVRAEQVHVSGGTPLVGAYTTAVGIETSAAPPESVQSATAETSNGRAERDASPVEDINSTATKKSELPAAAKDPETGTDMAGTIAARDGTSTTLGYVASGLGVAIQSVVGVDPINADKIAVETPKPDAEFVKPDAVVDQQVSEVIPESGLTPAVPHVPIPMPVNTSESNTVVEPKAPAAEPPAELAALTAKEATTPNEPSRQAIAAVPAPEPAMSATDYYTVVPATSHPEATAVNESVSPEVPAAPPASDMPKPDGPEPKTETSTATNGIATPSTPLAPSGVPATPSEKSVPPASSSTPTSSAPSTPAKKNQQPFPSSNSPSSTANSSPSSSKFGTPASRKKRLSIFGKFKNMFGHEKEEKEKEK